MRQMLGLQVLVLWTAPTWAVANDPVEELPPPRAETSLLRKESPNPNYAEHASWGLVGPNCRYYFVAADGLADYWRDGQRHIVKLQKENPAAHAQPDPNYLYYRETLAGHRWALGRQPGADRRYSVYFQAVDVRGVWSLFQRTRGSWEDIPSVNDQASVLIWEEHAGRHPMLCSPFLSLTTDKRGPIFGCLHSMMQGRTVCFDGANF